MDSVEQRLQRLEDIETARGIHHTYAAALDRPVPEVVAGLFAEDAVLHTPLGSFDGREAIREFYASAFEADPSVKRHFIVNPRVVDHARGRVTLDSYFLYSGRGAASLIGWGTYRDVVDVRTGSPIFAEKTIDAHVGTDLSAGWAEDSPRG
jgi:hypothetical protein